MTSNWFFRILGGTLLGLAVVGLVVLVLVDPQPLEEIPDYHTRSLVAASGWEGPAGSVVDAIFVGLAPRIFHSPLAIVMSLLLLAAVGLSCLYGRRVLPRGLRGRFRA